MIITSVDIIGTLLDIDKASLVNIWTRRNVMKAKKSYSGIAASTTAKGSIVIFAGIVVFIGGFVAWSAAGFGNAIVQFVRSL